MGQVRWGKPSARAGENIYNIRQTKKQYPEYVKKVFQQATKEKNNKESIERWTNNRYVQIDHIRGNQTGPETERGRASLVIRNYTGAIFLPIRLGNEDP